MVVPLEGLEPPTLRSGVSGSGAKRARMKVRPVRFSAQASASVRPLGCQLWLSGMFRSLVWPEPRPSGKLRPRRKGR